MWLSVWSKVQTCIWPSWCHCHSLSLASVKSRLVLPFWYQPTQVVPEKGRQMCVCVCVESFSYHLSCCKTCTVIPVKPWAPVPSGRSIISVLNILTASFLPNCSAHILILHLDSKIWQIPECIFSVFHHSERVQRSEQRSSLGQYEHGCRPLLLQLAKQHCQLPFPGMHHLPTEAQSHGLVSEHYRLNIKYDYYSITYTG